MRTLILSLFLIGSIQSYANNIEEKIISSRELLDTVVELESNESVDCIAPKVGQISWSCTMAGYCKFYVDITCVSRIKALSTNDQILRLSIAGQLIRQNISFLPEQNSLIRFKKLERQ